MKSRIKKIIETEKLTASEFAKKIGRQRSSVSHILSGRNNPSLEVVQEVLIAFNNLSPEWLLFGKGSMYKKTKPQELFAEDTVIQDKNEPTVKTKIQEEKNNPEEEKDATKTSEKKEPTPPKSKTEKIIIFNSDRTFIEYNQA